MYDIIKIYQLFSLQQKEVEFDFGYQLEFITTDAMEPERGATKRLKHE